MPTFKPGTWGTEWGAFWGAMWADPLPPEPDPRTSGAFTVEVFDKALTRKGWANGYQSLSVTLRHNDVGTAELVLPGDHPRIGDLLAQGARVVIGYDDKQIMSGMVEAVRMDGPTATSTATFSVTDDLALLREVLGYPVPSSPLTAQSPAYNRQSGPAETVVKDLMRGNYVTRLGLPLTIRPSQGRGDDIHVATRMHPLWDRLFPAVDQAGVGVRIYQAGDHLELDCYTPVVRDRVLSEASGVVTAWSWSRQAPTVTRVVVGAWGEGTDRYFYPKVDGDRESRWGRVREAFIDARDVESPQFGPVVERATEALDEGKAAFGFSLTLAETTTFRYGRTLNVGDRVTVQVADDLALTDVCREVTLTDSVEDGLTVTPTVGRGDDNPTRAMVRAIQALLRRVRNNEANR